LRREPFCFDYQIIPDKADDDAIPHGHISSKEPTRPKLVPSKRTEEKMRAISIIAGLLLTTVAALAQQTPNTPSNVGSNNNLGNERTDPNTPKPYQPQNPSPDTRTAPTSSTTGKGADSGGHPEAAPKK
jgi:hypothetical protein